MRVVWMIQREVKVRGYFLRPTAFDVQLYAGKESAEFELESCRNYAEHFGYKLDEVQKNLVRFTDGNGYTWTYTLYKKIMLP